MQKIHSTVIPPLVSPLQSGKILCIYTQYLQVVLSPPNSFQGRGGAFIYKKQSNFELLQLNLYFPATGNQTDRQSNLQPLLAWADSVLQKVSPRAWILLGTDANAKACLQTDHSGLWVAQSSSAVGSLHQGQLDFNGNFFHPFWKGMTWYLSTPSLALDNQPGLASLGALGPRGWVAFLGLGLALGLLGSGVPGLLGGLLAP